jgi:glucosamine 6-phosphate synthetase-like amidotransferase/phosphosugar isomerase protein
MKGKSKFLSVKLWEKKNMCTMSGYVGSKNAAAVLLQMSKQQEGWWSGYYSGLGILEKGKFQHNKLVGDFDLLTEETDVADFPGTCGLAHSRTNSGGDREWGHPFIGGTDEVLLIAQGSHGFFSDNSARIEMGNELLSAGFEFASAVPQAIGRYPLLKNGCAVHTSEIFAHAFSHFFRQFKDGEKAVREVYQRCPEEAVFLVMFRSIPDTIFAANINQHLSIGKDETGYYMASCGLAIPEDATWRLELPSNTLAVITPASIELETLLPTDALEIQEMLPAGLDEAFLTQVNSTQGAPLAAIIDQGLAPLFPKGKLVRRAVAGYQTAERLIRAGKIFAKDNILPGTDGKGTAVQTVFYPA